MTCLNKDQSTSFIFVFSNVCCLASQTNTKAGLLLIAAWKVFIQGVRGWLLSTKNTHVSLKWAFYFTQTYTGILCSYSSLNYTTGEQEEKKGDRGDNVQARNVKDCCVSDSSRQ